MDAKTFVKDLFPPQPLLGEEVTYNSINNTFHVGKIKMQLPNCKTFSEKQLSEYLSSITIATGYGLHPQESKRNGIYIWTITEVSGEHSVANLPNLFFGGELTRLYIGDEIITSSPANTLRFDREKKKLAVNLQYKLDKPATFIDLNILMYMIKALTGFRYITYEVVTANATQDIVRVRTLVSESDRQKQLGN